MRSSAAIEIPQRLGDSPDSGKHTADAAAKSRTLPRLLKLQRVWLANRLMYVSRDGPLLLFGVLLTLLLGYGALQLLGRAVSVLKQTQQVSIFFVAIRLSGRMGWANDAWWFTACTLCQTLCLKPVTALPKPAPYSERPRCHLLAGRTALYSLYRWRQ